jgi:D-serine deaminase-like pyridoxal phosphate-dependent protein
MSQAEPRIGCPKASLDTPSLLVDLDVLEGNIRRIAETCRANGVHWRPHVKSHKSPMLARRELAAGAIGITCAKLGEAEIMAEAGIDNILIANQIVGASKIDRLLTLAKSTEIIVAVDSATNVAELAEASASRGLRLSVVIEVDLGMGRAGVAPGEPVLTLAEIISRRKGLRFRGVMGWESHTVTIADPAMKASAVTTAIGALTRSAELCRARGHAVEIVSCGGTGTFPTCCLQAGVTEVQVGGGIFSDVHYATHFHIPLPFALTVLATVTSRPSETRIVLDAGKKAMSGDAALPQVIGVEPVASVRLSAEHAVVELSGPNSKPEIGDQVELVVGYSDTTIHLHEEIIAMRNGRVEEIWPVAARGKLK